jgi:hypothetical protein
MSASACSARFKRDRFDERTKSRQIWAQNSNEIPTDITRLTNEMAFNSMFHRYIMPIISHVILEETKFDRQESDEEYSHSNGKSDDKCRDDFESQENEGHHKDSRGRDDQIHESIMPDS